MDGISIDSSNGIIEQDAEQTINNLCRLSKEGNGCSESDRIILEIMLNKA